MKRYPLVQLGQYVGAGTVLGYEGTTGNSGGNHCHLVINDHYGDTSTESPCPVLYLYPFFTPFYYAEKAEEAGYEIASDYMSSTRTVFPYRQVIPSDLNIEGNASTFSGDNYPGIVSETSPAGNETIKIQNYVPYRVLIHDSIELIDETDERIVDFSKPVEADNTLGTVSYTGEKLQTVPQYFDDDFIERVKENNGKITGVSWALD